MNQNNLSSEKPLIYLDQNIYDKIRRGILGGLVEEIKKQFTVVYSDETLSEIDGNASLREDYLKILELFEPLFMKVVLTERFRVTDKVQFFRGSVREFFEKWKTNHYESPDVSESMMLLANKLVGGLKGIRFDELIDGQEVAFEKLMLDLIESTKGEEDIKPLILPAVHQMRHEFETVSKQMRDTFNGQIKDQENFRGNKEFREKIKIGPQQLNNIKSPDVMKKIWAELSESSELKSKDITFNKFFHLEANPLYPGEDYPLYSKVSTLYNALNSIGYYQDKDIERTNRFSGSLCDSTHAANAIFCKFLMTSDHAMSMKCSAIYEHLGIGTRIIYIDVKPPKSSDIQ